MSKNDSKIKVLTNVLIEIGYPYPTFIQKFKSGSIILRGKKLN